MSQRDDLSADVATRIAAVVEAELRNQVAEARQRLDAEVDERLARLRDVTDTLLERAAAVSAELDGLAAALRRASDDAADAANAPLGADLNGGRAEAAPEPVPAAVSPAQSAVEDLEAELGSPPPEAYRPTIVPRPTAAAVVEEPPPKAPSDAARLEAIEMALAGSSRDDVDRHLRSAYDVTDTSDLLDDVFGR